jgi:membrane protease YdiL (CAAX protease family)
MTWFSSFSGNSLQLLVLLQGFLLVSGMACLFALLHWSRNHPINSALLSKNLIQRAWAGGQVASVVGVLFLLYALSSGVGAFFSADQQTAARLVVALLVDGIMLLSITVVVRFWRKTNYSADFGLEQEKFKLLFFGFPLYLILLPFLVLSGLLTEALFHFFSHAEPSLQEVGKVVIESDLHLRVAYALVAIFVAPVFEELFFRGILFPALAKQWGVIQGALIVSILFAGIHFHAPSFLTLFLLSLAFCRIYWRSESLWPIIGMHMLQNAFAILNLNFFYTPS